MLDGKSGEKRFIGESIAKRSRYLLTLLILGFLVLVVASFYTQIIYGPDGAKEAKAARQDEVEIPAHRGTIFDASGSVFASSVDRYIIAVDQVIADDWVAIDCNDSNQSYCHQIDGHPVGANGVVGLARLLSKPLGRIPQELAYDLVGNSRYKIIARDVTPEVQRQIESLHIVGLLQMFSTSSRIYPNGNVAGSEVGVATTNPDGQITAQSGMELLFDEELSGENGTRRFERGGAGERIPTTSLDETPAKDGLDVKSSIDMDVQWKVQQLLDAQCQKVKAQICLSAVERVKTGEIVAIAANNEESAGSREVAAHGSRVFGTAFEPGSIVKTLTAGALIDLGIAQPESKYGVPDHIVTEFDQEIKDWHNHGTMTLTLAGIIGNSYNTGTTLASKPWSIESRYDYYFNKYGLGRLTGVDFPGETEGLVYEPQYWDGRTRDLVLFGQGMSVSALQIVNAYATIANGGVNPIPTLVSATRKQGGAWESVAKETPPYQVISPEAAGKTLGILESCVVLTGCKSGAIPEYRTGGKTGTAEMITNAGTDFVHSYIGVFPMDDPEYVVGFFVKDRNDLTTTVSSTAPNFKQIANFIIQKYGIPPSSPAAYIPPAS
jgi:cell division protein FtsI (penicillin-binding protein 3)